LLPSISTKYGGGSGADGGAGGGAAVLARVLGAEGAQPALVGVAVNSGDVECVTHRHWGSARCTGVERTTARPQAADGGGHGVYLYPYDAALVHV